MSSQPPDDAARSDADEPEGSDGSDSPGDGGTAAGADGEGRGSPADTAADSSARRAERFRQARERILGCLDDPAASASQLPFLLSALEAEDQAIRWLAATACCQIAVETDDEEIVEYLVRRLTDRLTAEGISLELTVALDYISSAYADRVGPLLAEIAADETGTRLPDVGGFTRSYYYGAEGRDGSHLGVAGAETADNPEHVVADREREERERIEYERRRREAGDETDDEEAATDQLAGNSSTMVQESAAVTSVTDQSRFDELYVRGERYTGRYATTYEALVGTGGEQRAVALRLFHGPEEAASLPAFGRDLADQLADIVAEDMDLL